MRGYIPFLLALSASYTTVTALPRPRIQPRDDAAKPKYSVVPLEPGDDDPLLGGSGSGDGNGSSGSGNGGSNGDENGDGVVTVIHTVVQTRKPVTEVITQTEKPSVVTVPGKTVTKAVPTTVSVINVDDEPVVTQTIVISHTSASKPKASEKPSTTHDSETTDNEAEPTAQEPSDSLSSAVAPGATSKPEPEPEPEPEPQPKPQPNPQPQPEPEPSTVIESSQSAETPSVVYTSSPPVVIVTVTQTSPVPESSPAGSEPTTLLIMTTQEAEVSENTAAPSSESPVAPSAPQETFVPDPASNKGESWSTATVPYKPPVAPTTFLTSCTTSTTTSEVYYITPGPVYSSKTHDDGAWHTTYPSWNGNDLAM